MSHQDPKAGLDGWELRHGEVAGSAGTPIAYLERPGRREGHFERFYPHGCDCFRIGPSPHFFPRESTAVRRRGTPLGAAAGAGWKLRATDSPYQVVVTLGGRRSFADLAYGSGYEVGGGLWGHRDDRTIVVRFATQNNMGGRGGESTSSERDARGAAMRSRLLPTESSQRRRGND